MNLYVYKVKILQRVGYALNVEKTNILNKLGKVFIYMGLEKIKHRSQLIKFYVLI